MSIRTRRRHGSAFFSQVQDPGKDLFAYLFLVMLVFSFVILLTYEQKVRNSMLSKSPKEVSRGKSSFAVVGKDEIGRLAKKDGRVCIIFGEKAYYPETDISSMENDGLIKRAVTDGTEKRVLYIVEDDSSRIYLREYLETFAALSSRGIDVAFAKRE